MEKTATQRMVGFLVIVALVIIILPLFSGNKEPIVQQVAAKAPEFPNQSVRQQPTLAAPTSVAVLSDKATVIPLIKQPALPQAMTPVQPLVGEKNIVMKATPIPSQDIKAEPVQPPAQTIIVPPLAAPVQPQKPDAADITPAIANDVNVSVETQVSSEQDKTLSHIADTGDKNKISLKTPKKDKTTMQLKSSIAKLNQPAWAIQMGNFKEKENALRLVDQLRSAGYKAFTREIKSPAGSRVRVYIGPEFKQAYAVALSNKIENELKLRGIIVAYKPLEL